VKKIESEVQTLTAVAEKMESVARKKTSTAVTKRTQTRETSIATLTITTVDVERDSHALKMIIATGTI